MVARLRYPEIAARAPAVLEAWFPGERGGQAIAEALLGIVNPGGRLPVSIPRHVGQLPLPYDRKPSNQGRYVELDGSPLWPFGFGLSYTTFAYADLSLSRAEMKVSESIDVACTVSNTGVLAGDEVVQLNYPTRSPASPARYAGSQPASASRSDRGRAAALHCESPASCWNFGAAKVAGLVEPGEYRLSLGGGQSGQLNGSFQVVA